MTVRPGAGGGAFTREFSRALLVKWLDEAWTLLNRFRRGGRHRNFDPAIAAILIEKLVPKIIEYKATHGILPSHKIALGWIARMDEASGVESSARVIGRQIITPALRKVKPPRPKR
jgi:hypothetical protein